MKSSPTRRCFPLKTLRELGDSVTFATVVGNLGEPRDPTTLTPRREASGGQMEVSPAASTATWVSRSTPPTSEAPNILYIAAPI